MEATTIVAERPRRVDVLWGFMTVVFAAALVRGHLGAGSTTARLAIDLGFGAAVLITVSAWIWFRRHPARLEITPDEVAFWHRGMPNATRLVGPGELYVYQTHIGAKSRLQFLKVTGSEEAIALTMFDHEEVKAAARANGWRFVDDSGAEPA